MQDRYDVDLTEKQIGLFRDQGFLHLGRLTTDEEVTWLSQIYDEVFSQQMGYTPEAVPSSRDEPPRHSLVTLFAPETLAPELKQTCYFRNARNALMRLFGVAEANLRCGWRIFFKPAFGGETSWHQDAAYRPPPHQGGSVWMPLDPAPVERSCLYYIGGSHLEELRPHYLRHGHLMTDDVDPAHAVACPLQRGEATVHHCRTLHYAGPNRTNQPRRALAIVSQVTGTRPSG